MTCQREDTHLFTDLSVEMNCPEVRIKLCCASNFLVVGTMLRKPNKTLRGNAQSNEPKSLQTHPQQGLQDWGNHVQIGLKPCFWRTQPDICHKAFSKMEARRRGQRCSSYVTFEPLPIAQDWKLTPGSCSNGSFCLLSF